MRHISSFYRSRFSTVILYFLMAMAVMLATLMPIISAHAAGLGDLFSNDSFSNDSSSSNGQQKEFLNVDEAFTVVPVLQGSTLTVSMQITPGHYIYKDKVKLNLPEGINATPFAFNQSASFVDDPSFGKVAVFDQNQVTATTTLSRTQAAGNSATATDQTATLVWQGCAKAGLCYPPQREKITLTLPERAPSPPANDNANATNTLTPSSAAAARSSGSKNTPNTPPTAIAKPTINNNVTPKPVASTATQPTITPTKNNTNTTSTSALSTTSNVKPAKNLTVVEQGAQAAAITASNDGAKADSLGQDTTGGTTNTQSTEADTEANDTNQNEVANEIIGTEFRFNDPANNSTSNFASDPTLGTTTSVTNSSNTITNASQAGALQHSVDIDNDNSNDPFGLATHTGLAFVLLFLAGLTLAFTPCVLPMLPIVSNIIAHQHKPSAMQGILLTGSYALGVSIAYGILGMLVAIFGVSFGIIGWLQHPAVLLAFAAIFAVFALYMADAFVWRTPAFISDRLGRASKLGDNYLGSMPGSFVVGLLSALVVSPCVSLPLFGALFAVSTIGNPLLGFGALFMLGLGLSSPLILLGATQANFMPKAGAWMNWIKMGFALMLFAVSLLLLERVLISPFMLLIWALWFLIVAKWLWSWQERGTVFTKALALLLGIWAIGLILGAAMGSKDNWQPLQGLNHQAYADKTVAKIGSQDSAIEIPHSNDITVTSLAQLDAILLGQDKVLVDIVAEWCVECRIMEKALFNNPPSKLAAWQVVKLDITQSNVDSQAVLQRYQIPGPPTLLYYVNGKLQKIQVGETTRDEFETVLDNLS